MFPDSPNFGIAPIVSAPNRESIVRSFRAILNRAGGQLC